MPDTHETPQTPREFEFFYALTAIAPKSMLSSGLGRRSFYSHWDEILYLYDKLLYWLYHRQDFRKSRLYAGRLAKVLRKTPSSKGAIKGQECWSLVYEARRNLRKAIVYRQKEIRLIQRLHRISAKDSPALEGYGIEDLCDRLDLLAILQANWGNLGRAIRTLEKSRELCQKHRIPFDGKNLLTDYLAEKVCQTPKSKFT